MRSYLLPGILLFLVIAAPPCPEALLARAQAGRTACCIRTCDDLWIVNTRCLDCNVRRNDPLLQARYFRRQAPGRWERRSHESFSQSEAGLTCIFVHGNRIPSQDVVKRGLWVYRTLTCRRPADVPLRFVFWSWPTSPDKGPLRDARKYAPRSDVEAFYLSRVLSTMNPDEQVSIIGFSLGARVISASLHLLAGGSINGKRLRKESDATVRPRAVLLAAAVHNYWLTQGSRYGFATQQADQILALNNSRDPALKRYHAIYRKEHPSALGFTGMSNAACLENRDAYSQRNVACYIGREHAMKAFLDAPAVARMISSHMLWDRGGHR